MDLRKSLDYKFETETDTETLAVGLEKKGIKFIYELDGMFATLHVIIKLIKKYG